MVFAIACFVGLLLFSQFVLMGFRQTDAQSIILQRGWTVQINDRKYTDVDTASFSFDAVGIGDILILENRLPRNPWEYAVLRVDAWYSLIDVFIDNELVFSYGHELHNQFRSVGTGYHLIALDAYEPECPLKIVLTVTEPEAFAKLQPVCLDKAGSSVVELWKQRGVAFGSSIFFIIIGLLLFVIGIIWTVREIKNAKLLLVGLCSFFIGLISFYDNDCAVLFSQNYELNTWVNHVALYGTNISLLMLLYSALTERYLDRILIKIFIIFFSVYAGFMLILDVRHIMHLVATRTVMMIFFGVEVVVAVIICLFNILTQSKEYRIPSIGFLSMIGFIGIDLLRYGVVKRLEFDTTQFNGTMVSMGAIVFLISVFVNFYYEFSAAQKQKAETAVLNQYKNLDYDTGMLVQAAKPKILASMAGMGITEYTQITVNVDIEEYIHSQSPMVIENMIFAFAHALYNSFLNKGYIFRGKGSSFEILTAADKKIVEEGLAALQKEVKYARQPSMSADFVYSAHIRVMDVPKGIEVIS